MVTLYSKPKCVQCNATERAFEEHSVEYTTINLAEVPEALEHVKSLGYLQAPVVVTEDDHWSGFRPDKIKALAA